MWRSWLISSLVAFLALGALTNAEVQAEEAIPIASGLAAVALTALPREAQHTHRLILAGGPFSYDKDGIVFGNRERILPAKPRGHYHEYTVAKPDVRNRGAKRLVCGGPILTFPDICYYTDDHYASFKQVVQ